MIYVRLNGKAVAGERSFNVTAKLVFDGKDVSIIPLTTLPIEILKVNMNELEEALMIARRSAAIRYSPMEVLHGATEESNGSQTTL